MITIYVYTIAILIICFECEHILVVKRSKKLVNAILGYGSDRGFSLGCIINLPQESIAFYLLLSSYNFLVIQNINWPVL